MLSRLFILLMLLVSSVSLTNASDTSAFQLAYLHGHSDLIVCESLSIAGLDGSPPQDFNLPLASFCTEPLWSPDGKYLALSTPGLMLLDMAHDNLKVIIDPVTGTQVGITMWSQDGAYLLWNQHKGDTSSWALMDMKTRTIQEFESFSQIHIAPTEAHYLDSADHHLLIFRSGQQPQELRYPGKQLPCGWPDSIRWDTAQLLCLGLDVDLKTYEDDVVRFDSDTQTIVKLTDTPDLDEVFPEWSPDGTQIVYQVTEMTSGKTWLQMMASDGSNVRRLTKTTADDVTPVFMVWSGDDALPQWSPDGQYIAFQRQSGYKGETTKIYVIKADGSGLQYIDDGLHPAWRPISQS